MSELIEPIWITNDSRKDALVVAKEDKCHLACNRDSGSQSKAASKDVPMGDVERHACGGLDSNEHNVGLLFAFLA